MSRETVEFIAALAGLLTAGAGVLGGVALIVKNVHDVFKSRRDAKRPPDPPVALGMTVEPDDHADDAIDAWKKNAEFWQDRALRAEAEIERLQDISRVALHADKDE